MIPKRRCGFKAFWIHHDSQLLRQQLLCQRQEESHRKRTKCRRLQDFFRVVLIGHSFGAALALRLAAQANDRVAGFVLVGAYVPPEQEIRMPIFSLMRWLFYLPAVVRTGVRDWSN